MLLGGNAGIDDLVKNATPELASMRSFELKGLLKEDASADFLILLSPAGSDGGSVKVDAAKFVSGSESLRPFADKLITLDYGSAFPDASPAKLCAPRRAIVLGEIGRLHLQPTHPRRRPRHKLTDDPTRIVILR